eukprot:9983016-Karenia_brevis.AAC.1
MECINAAQCGGMHKKGQHISDGRWYREHARNEDHYIVNIVRMVVLTARFIGGILSYLSTTCGSQHYTCAFCEMLFLFRMKVIAMHEGNVSMEHNVVA